MTHLIALLLLFLSLIRADQPNVKINDYSVSGVYQANGNVKSFLGLNYATKPDGINRFKYASYIDISNDINATKHSSTCFRSKRGTIVDSTFSSEDCLKIDLYIPTITKKVTTLPLMVLFSNKKFEDDFLNTYVDKNMAVAVVRFREGIFGYFYTGQTDDTNNYGQNDMLLALKWLSNYKNNFGITGLTTVVAEDDAACNLAWVLERDDVNESMFQKVVLLNGGNLYADRGVPSDVVRKYSARLLKKIDCHVPSFQQAADCLRTKSVGDIKNSLDLIGFEEIDGIPFKPYSENKIAPQIKKEYIGLIGIGKKLMDEYKGDNEFSVDYSYADFKLFLHRLINEMENNNAALVRRIILHHYIYSRGDKMDTYYLWRASRRLLHHKLLAVPLRKMIFEDLMANKNNKIWLFEHESVNPLDTCYTINPKNNMVDFCAKLNDYISGMVIRGQPTDSSANSSKPVFPQLGTSKENYYLQLKEGGSIELDSPFYQKPMALFNSLIPFLNKLDLVGKRVPMVDAYADLLQDTTLTNLYQDDDYQRWNEEEHDEL